MRRLARAWILLILLAGPVLAYVAFGSLWLYERGWLLLAGSIWVASGIVFTILAARWTKSTRYLLPPIDWDAPQTFNKADREAWRLVEQVGDEGDQIAIERLTELDLYIDTGKRLAELLSRHYQPVSTDPIEHVPLIEFLTALELASEDLTRLCRQVPGADMLTPFHLKKAVKVAGYIQRANDFYSYLLPIFSPVTGLTRLGAQQLMVKPAWKNMQQNLLRWFFRAYVNRLGVHLVELYSGRLAIGATRYRKLTRRNLGPVDPNASEGVVPRIAVVGARDSGKSRLVEALEQARRAFPSDRRIDRLREAELVDVPGYSGAPGSETSRDRASRNAAVEKSVNADMLILVIDARRDALLLDAAFLQEWDQWFVEHPAEEHPPSLVVLAGIDAQEFGGEWRPPYEWERGLSPREVAVRARLESTRLVLPPGTGEIVPVGLDAGRSFGVAESLLPAILALWPRTERISLIRHFQNLSSRSKARRLISQVGEQGRSLWRTIRSARGAKSS